MITVHQVKFSLSREELLVIMRTLGAPQLPGFDLAWAAMSADGVPSPATQAKMEVAMRDLIARGVLALAQPGSARPLEMAVPVAAAVGACAFGDDVIFLSLNRRTNRTVLYLHEYRGVAVAHSTIATDIHLFQALNGRVGLLQAIDELLELADQAAPPVPAGVAYTVHVLRARDAALAGRAAEAEAALTAGGLAEPTRSALCNAMTNATALGAAILGWRDAAGKEHDAAVAVVVAPRACFLLHEDTGARPSVFRVVPASAAAVRQWFTERLPAPTA